MKLRRKFAFLAAIAIVAVGAAQAPLSTAGAADASKPRSGGTLKMTVAYSTASLDPAKFAYYTCCATGAYANPVYDDLLRIDPTTAKISPGLALSLTSTDGINWTLKLRKGLKFSDNTPLDAEAVKFNWDRANSNVIYQARPTSIQITGMQVVDPETLKITLGAQNGFFDKEVASTLGVIASPTAIKEQGDKYGNPGTIPVGAGPYVMTSWVPDSRVVYKRNPNYWDAPRPYIENLELQINLDAESNYTSVTTGQNDWAVSASPDMTDRAKAAGLKTFEVPNFGVISYELNLGHPPFNDPRAREAINAAIDPNLFNALYYNSKGTISTNVLSKDSPYYDKSLAAPKYDAKKAQKLFSEIAKETGKPVTFRVSGYVGNSPQVAEILVTLLSKYRDVSATTQIVPLSSSTTLVKSADWETIAFSPGWVNTEFEPQLSQIVLSTGRNFAAGYADPAQDKLILDGKAALTQAERKKNYVAFVKNHVKNNYSLVTGVIAPPATHIYNGSKLKDVTWWMGGLDYDKIWMSSSS